MATSTAAVSALMQKASQQYLECRRRVSAKADEVSKLDEEIQSLFERITDSSATRGAKSVGRLELSIVAVEGDAPVDDAVISVEIDPEYEEPEAPVEEAKAEEPKEEKTEEAAEVEKPEGDEEATEEGEEKTEEPKAEETATEVEKAEEQTEDKVEGKAEEVAEVVKPTAQRRSVLWSDAEGLPLSVVFDPVQSREAVVTIAIAAPAQDGEESEPVKEFRIPVSSLFQTGSINRWYVLKKVEHVHVDKAAITEVDDEVEPKEAAAEEPVKEETAPEAEKTEEEVEKPNEEDTEKPTVEDAEKPAEDTEKPTEDAEKPAEEAEKPTEEAEKPAPEEESTEAKETEEEEPKTELAAPQQTFVEGSVTVESEDKVVVLKEGKLHVQVHFTMSEIEKLSQTAIALSQQKQEAEATLAVLEREAASLRTKYERLSASQRSLTANASVAKPRSTLLGGRGLGAAAPRVEKSAFQKTKDSVAAVLTPQRTQVLTSFAIFVGSVALFHFQGDNLLA